MKWWWQKRKKERKPKKDVKGLEKIQGGQKPPSKETFKDHIEELPPSMMM